MHIKINKKHIDHFNTNFLYNKNLDNIRYIFVAFDLKNNKISFNDLTNEQIKSCYSYSQSIGHNCHHHKYGLINKILSTKFDASNVILICDERLIFLYTTIFSNIISVQDFDYNNITCDNSVFMF